MSFFIIVNISMNIVYLGNLSRMIKIGESKGSSRLIRLNILKTQIYLILFPFLNISSKGIYPVSHILYSSSLADNLII